MPTCSKVLDLYLSLNVVQGIKFNNAGRGNIHVILLGKFAGFFLTA
jgi:hypothetical protein